MPGFQIDRTILASLTNPQFFFYVKTKLMGLIEQELQEKTPGFCFQVSNEGAVPQVEFYKTTLSAWQRLVQQCDFDRYSVECVYILSELLKILDKNHVVFREGVIPLDLFALKCKLFHDSVVRLIQEPAMRGFDFYCMHASLLSSVGALMQNVLAPARYEMMLDALRDPHDLRFMFVYQYSFFEIILESNAENKKAMMLSACLDCKIPEDIVDQDAKEEYREREFEVILSAYQYGKEYVRQGGIVRPTQSVRFHESQSRSINSAYCELEQLRNSCIAELVNRIDLYSQTILNGEPLSSNEIEHAKKAKILKTMLQSADVSIEEDRKKILGIMDYIYHRKIIEKTFIDKMIEPFLHNFKSAALLPLLAAATQTLNEELSKSFVASSASFFSKSIEYEHSEPPPLRASTPPPS